MTESQHLEGYLLKDENSNQVKIFQKETEGAAHIITEYEPLYTEGETTLLKVTLVTGKPIRSAHTYPPSDTRLSEIRSMETEK